MTRRILTCLAACAATFVVTLVAPWPIATAQQPPADAIPDLAGLWVQIDPVGSGRGGLNVGRAMVKAGAAEMVRGRILPGPRGGGVPRPQAANTPNAAGVPYIAGTGVPLTCAFMSNGMQFLISHSSAKHIIQDKNEVILAGEMPSIRRFFLDGRPLPDPATLTPDGFGYSVGRYENGDLIVETIGLTWATAPRGGFIRPETKLIERFRLTDGGKRITFTQTWDDPAIYEKPHSYDIIWQRQADTDYAMEEWCDPSDPVLQESITPPVQR